MKLLRPTVWLIHLGVNDERHQVTPEQFATNGHRPPEDKAPPSMCCDAPPDD